MIQTDCDLVGVLREVRLLYLGTPEELRRTTMGGEMLQLEVEPGSTQKAQLLLLDDPEVKDVTRAHGHPNLLRVYVEDAGTALPVVLSNLQDRGGVRPRRAEPRRSLRRRPRALPDRPGRSPRTTQRGRHRTDSPDDGT